MSEKLDTSTTAVMEVVRRCDHEDCYDGRDIPFFRDLIRDLCFQRDEYQKRWSAALVEREVARAARDEALADLGRGPLY